MLRPELSCALAAAAAAAVGGATTALGGSAEVRPGAERGEPSDDDSDFGQKECGQGAECRGNAEGETEDEYNGQGGREGRS